MFDTEHIPELAVSSQDRIKNKIDDNDEIYLPILQNGHTG